MDHIDISISSLDSNKSIKTFLKENHVGRGRIEYLRVNKLTKINNIFVSLETLLKENDILSIYFEESVDFLPFDKPLDILYEDDYLLAVCKPKNMIIHPDNKINGNGTLSNMVASYYIKKHISRNVRYLHRLDKETTGIVLFAKDFYTEAKLLKDIELNNIERIYIGYVKGKLRYKHGFINASIMQCKHNSSKMMVSSSNLAKASETEYTLLKSFKDISKVEYKLYTGRTHQIRVHSAYIGYPLLGDYLYGGDLNYINRVALHCYKISFIHPITKLKTNIICPPANDLLALETIDK